MIATVVVIVDAAVASAVHWRLFAGISGIMFINVSTMKTKCRDTPRFKALFGTQADSALYESYIISFRIPKKKTSYIGLNVCG